MIPRNIITLFRTWAATKERKPLILRGARQVGKTTAVELFAGEFEVFIHLNLEKSEDGAHFKRGLSVGDILQSVCLAKKVRFIPGRTLLFLDEIQAVPEAVAMMRYFYEELKSLHVIAAGSLLEAMLGIRQINFPVGRVESMFLHPFSFEEYLIALNETEALDAYRKMPVPAFAHETLLRLYHQYALVGGMPEIVATYARSRDIVSLTPLYQSLVSAYLDDVAKYARNASMVQVVRHAIESVFFEAGKRITFEGFGRSNYRSREMGEALRILERAMLINLVYPTTALKPPAIPDKKKAPRLQFLDTGLMNFKAGLQGYFFQFKDLSGFYQGRVAEHIVGQELLAAGGAGQPPLVFWVREKKQSSAEVDYLFPFEDGLVPVEVKSGKSGTLRSLHQFIDRSEQARAVRLYAGPLGGEEVRTPQGKSFFLLNLPYYLTGRLKNYIERMGSNTEPILGFENIFQ